LSAGIGDDLLLEHGLRGSEFPGRREILDVQVAELSGMKYLRQGGWTSGGSGAAEAAGWIE